MSRCEALGCSSEDTSQGGISFFPVPNYSKLKRSWEANLGRNDLTQDAVICEKHFASEDVITDENGGKALKPDAVPYMFGDKSTEDVDSSVRRSNRKRVIKKRGMNRGGETKSPKKKAVRQQLKTALKSPEKNKEKSKTEDENSDPNQDLIVRLSPGKRRKNQNCQKTSDSPQKVKLIGDDERGHAIAEWYLVDIFEATRLITSVLREGTLVTDDLVANMEETIIEMMSKLLQRLSSVLITSLEQEYGIKCNIMDILRNLHENIKDKVSQLVKEENSGECSETAVEPEDSYEKALKKLDPGYEPLPIIEEVISAPIDDHLMVEHAYSRPVEEEEEKRGTQNKGELHKTNLKLQCGFCAYKTFWKSKLKRHMKRHLYSKKRLECPECEYSATTAEAYQRHLRTHTGEKPFSCNLCSFKTANKSNLNRHYVTHTDLKPFSCLYCEHTTRQKSSMVLHMLTHTTTLRERGKGLKNIYACGECNFITTFRQEFVRHGKTHRTYNCGHCDFVSVDYNKLKAHQSAHNGLEHICQLCQRKCKSADELRLHLETHSKKEELVCQLCKYRTVQPAYFKRHLACHSGERPFKCDICPKVFRLQSHLSEHVRKHEIGPYCKRARM